MEVTWSMTQRELDRQLKWGVILSLLWLAGVGSLISFVLGIRAIRAIRSSGATLVGAGRAWWCMIVGGIGLLIWMPILVVGILNQF